MSEGRRERKKSYKKTASSWTGVISRLLRIGWTEKQWFGGILHLYLEEGGTMLKE